MFTAIYGDIHIRFTPDCPSGHPVDYPGQFAPLPVVPVVVEQLGDGQDDEAGEDPAQGPQHRLPPLSLLRPGAQHRGADLHQLKHNVMSAIVISEP